LAGLKQAIDAKLSETRETIDLQRAGRITEATEVVRNNDGKRFMNELRSVLSDLQSDTDDRLRVIVADQLGAANTLRWVTIGGAVAILIVVGGSIL
ncbi:histidine kinase, partial [bacterium M00.F.Ca.ET.229.01.1.1]